MDIRDATRDDVEAIVAMLADDDLGRFREDPTLPLAEPYWTAFDAIDADPRNRLVVLEDRGEVLATLQVTFLPSLTFRGGWRAHVDAVRTSAHRRGEGLGRHLLEWVIGEAERQGCHLVQLMTDATRDEARRFYEDLGFDATHTGMKLHLRSPRSGPR